MKILRKSLSRAVGRAKLFYYSIRNKAVLINNRRKRLITLEIKGKRPRLVIHEKYEKTAKWISRLTLFLGILFCFISLPYFLNLIASLLLIMVEQIIERIVYRFTTIFIQPIPEWNSEEWLGMLFGIPQDIGKNIFKLGMVFKTEDFARKVFTTIRAWNYSQDTDVENNINISFIIESDSEYSTYIYPSLQRKSIKLAKKKAESEVLEKKQIKEHEQLIMSVIICKKFPNPPDSNFRFFRLKYNESDTFEFGAYFIESLKDEMKEAIDKSKPIHDIGGLKQALIKPVLKTHLKIMDRKELTENDVEYQHGRFVMKK